MAHLGLRYKRWMLAAVKAVMLICEGAKKKGVRREELRAEGMFLRRVSSLRLVNCIAPVNRTADCRDLRPL